MWNKTKSLLLSRILTAVMTFIILILTFFIPALSELYSDFSSDRGLFAVINVTIPLCITLYICEVLALFAMHSLSVLLGNLNRDEVFVNSNTVCLRRISWACMLAGFVLFIFGLWRFIFIIAAYFAILLGLVMRVLKNVFEKAVEIKSENDFTI